MHITVSDQIHAFVWESMHENNCNTYLVKGKTNILIDPGHARHFSRVEKSLETVLPALSDIGLVIITHAHPDHLEAARYFANTPTLLAVHEKDWEMVQSASSMAALSMPYEADMFEPDIFLEEGTLNVHDTVFEVFHTPGHSPGSICLYKPDEKALFTGDLVFKEGLGRVDLPGGNGETLKKSIEKISEIDCDIVLPGHGELIQGKHAVAENFAGLKSYYFRFV